MPRGKPGARLSEEPLEEPSTSAAASPGRAHAVETEAAAGQQGLQPLVPPQSPEEGLDEEYVLMDLEHAGLTEIEVRQFASGSFVLSVRPKPGSWAGA
jgi:hypothetical protein